jgi:hypothetical protein
MLIAPESATPESIDPGGLVRLRQLWPLAAAELITRIQLEFMQTSTTPFISWARLTNTVSLEARRKLLRRSLRGYVRQGYIV